MGTRDTVCLSVCSAVQRGAVPAFKQPALRLRTPVAGARSGQMHEPLPEGSRQQTGSPSYDREQKHGSSGAVELANRWQWQWQWPWP